MSLHSKLRSFHYANTTLDLFANPVGYRTSLGKMHCSLLVFTGICSETEVSEQLDLSSTDCAIHGGRMYADAFMRISRLHKSALP
jgi:hypothetical protein